MLRFIPFCRIQKGVNDRGVIVSEDRCLLLFSKGSVPGKMGVGRWQWKSGKETSRFVIESDLIVTNRVNTRQLPAEVHERDGNTAATVFQPVRRIRLISCKELISSISRKRY